MKTLRDIETVKPLSNAAPALVIGVDVSALNVVRGLGRKGIEVYVLGSNSRDYAAVSRFARFMFCSDLTNEFEFIASLRVASRKIGRKSVLICTSDLHVLYVSRNREVLSDDFIFVMPEHKVIEDLMDKKNLNDFACLHGFPVPMTYFSSNRKDLCEIAAKIPYPCVVKPLYRTVYWSQHVPPDKKVMKATSEKDLLNKLEEIGALDEQLILQEWIPGGDEEIYFCLAYIDRDGKPLALLPGRKLRQYPFLTGVTSMAESIVNSELAQLSFDILSTGGCVGLCSVEFKLDAAMGTFKMTEPTVGRVDLQEGVSISAGMNIPYIAYLDAVGMSPLPQTDYSPSVKWLNEPFEFNSYLAWNKSDGSSGSFFKHYGGKRTYALLAKDDPMPFARFLVQAGKRSIRFMKRFIPHSMGS